MFHHQPELRWSMEHLAEEALTRCGVELDPRGFLVGIPEGDTSLPVLIEPRRRAFALDQVTGVLDDIETRLRRRMGELEDVPAELEEQEHYRLAVLEGCRRDAVVDALHQAARFTDRTVRVGMSVVVGSYRIFPVLAVLTEAWEDLETLRISEVDGLSVPTTFPEAVVMDVLRAASRELDRTNPSSLLGVDAGAVLRSAADTFVNGVLARTGSTSAHGLRDALDAVAGQTYEGRASLGSMVLASREHPCVELDVAFTQDVPVSIVRSFRKVLEMSRTGMQLVSDGRDVYGLGVVADDYDPATEEVFRVRLAGNGSWELWHGRHALLRVDQGQPSLPQDQIDDDSFLETFTRVFPDATPRDREAVWSLAQACTDQRYGTMLVVHPDARA